MGYCAESHLSVCIVCDATVAFIKRCNILSVIIEMADFREQSACTASGTALVHAWLSHLLQFMLEFLLRSICKILWLLT